VKRAAAVIAAIAIALALSGCEDGPECLDGHYDLMPVSQYNAATKSTSIQWIPVWQCDRYATTGSE
jgi:hypothetical protein